MSWASIDCPLSSEENDFESLYSFWKIWKWILRKLYLSISQGFQKSHTDVLGLIHNKMTEKLDDFAKFSGIISILKNYSSSDM